jgi:hypothetical protein
MKGGSSEAAHTLSCASVSTWGCRTGVAHALLCQTAALKTAVPRNARVPSALLLVLDAANLHEGKRHQTGPLFAGKSRASCWRAQPCVDALAESAAGAFSPWSINPQTAVLAPNVPVEHVPSQREPRSQREDGGAQHPLPDGARRLLRRCHEERGFVCGRIGRGRFRARCQCGCRCWGWQIGARRGGSAARFDTRGRPRAGELRFEPADILFELFNFRRAFAEPMLQRLIPREV